MIKQIRLILVVFFFPTTISAQFINLQIRVEPELSASVEQDLNFGQLIMNSGINEIELGDVNMGIFNIRAYHTQNIFVSLDVPEYLTHSNPSVEDVIPLELNVAYNNLGTRNVNNAINLINNSGYLAVSKNARANSLTNDRIWQELMLYVYGNINVGNINEGLYSAEILLFLQYD